MIRFGTGGWRAVIGDEFTRENIRRIAAALARRMQAGSPSVALYTSVMMRACSMLT